MDFNVTLLCLLQAAIQQVDEAMTEMVEQKKKLAYEKGNLQSQVQQLQLQVQKLDQKKCDFKQLTQVNKVLQNKYIQVSIDSFFHVHKLFI